MLLVHNAAEMADEEGEWSGAGIMYLTTHMAELSAALPDVVLVEHSIEYRAKKQGLFEVNARLTLPDGSVMEEIISGETDPDSETGYLESYLVQRAFREMIAGDGRILTGEYLYEISIGQERISQVEFSVVPSDVSYARTFNRQTVFYADEACSQELERLPINTAIRILDLVMSSDGTGARLYKAEYQGQTGYVGVNDVFLIADERLYSDMETAKYDGVQIATAYTVARLTNGDLNNRVSCLTRGQAEYCAAQKDCSLEVSLFVKLNRPLLEEGLGAVEARITRSNGKKETVKLEVVQAMSAEESWDAINAALTGAKHAGLYEVSFYAGGGRYAKYTAYDTGGMNNMWDGVSKNWAFALRTRVTAPDGSVYETDKETPLVDSTGVDWEQLQMYYVSGALEELFAKMKKKGGVQCGVYTLEVYLEEGCVYTQQIEVLDDPSVWGMMTETSTMYQDKKCTKPISEIPADMIVEMLDKPSVVFETTDKYGRYTEIGLTPVRYEGQEGYVNSMSVNLMVGEELPEKIGRDAAQ